MKLGHLWHENDTPGLSCCEETELGASSNGLRNQPAIRVRVPNSCGDLRASCARVE
jgi:hypothetical protein